MVEELSVIKDSRGENKLLQAFRGPLLNLQRKDNRTGVFSLFSKDGLSDKHCGIVSQAAYWARFQRLKFGWTRVGCLTFGAQL